jgi:hypothetical protein
MTDIPAQFRDLLTEKKAFAHLATIMPDGTPQVTPVWFDYTSGAIRVNTAKGRVKARNMKEGAPVALSILDPTMPTATSRSAAGCGGPPRRGRARISTRWPRNISARTNTRSASRARSG